MTAKAKLAFGVEFEVLLKPKTIFITELEKTCPGWVVKFEQAKHAESEAAAQDDAGTNTNTARKEADALRLRLRKELANLLRGDAIPTATTSSNYEEWSVVDEPTLDEVPGYCEFNCLANFREPCIESNDSMSGRVELVSRTITSKDEWQKELGTVLHLLNLSFDMICTTGCSMHVHVSPSAKPTKYEGRWTPGQLNKIMKAISYFTVPVTQIMPAERKMNPWAMPNMLSEDVAKARPQLSTAYNQVQTETWKPLFDIYDRQMRTNLDKIQAFSIMGNCRYIAWNFAHIPGTCGTVEFRQCPGITKSPPAKHWESFTLGFIYAAAFQANLDWTQIAAQNTHPSVEDLDSVTKAGIGGLEPTCQGALESLEEDTSPAKVWSAEETRKIVEKKALLESRDSPESYPEDVSFCDAPRFVEQDKRTYTKTWPVQFDRTPEGTPTGSPTASPRH